MASWSDPVDIYCERTDPSFWSEPVNAVSNAAFLVAAVLAFVRWQRHQSHDFPILALIVLTGVIGVGSFIFHTVATRGAELLDVIPIAVFVYAYLFLAMRRLLAVSWEIALAIVVVFVVVSRGVTWAAPEDFLNGSTEYLFPLAALIAVGWLGRAPGRPILLAAGVFTVSLIFRSIDQMVCPAFPLGTHFIWHMLNATVLYILLWAALPGPADAVNPNADGRIAA